jgi:hypothetical protein
MAIVDWDFFDYPGQGDSGAYKGCLSYILGGATEKELVEPSYGDTEFDRWCLAELERRTTL